jgi:hypothetical protein
LSAVELLERHVARPFYDLFGFELDSANRHAVEFLEHCVRGAIEAATYSVEQGDTPDPDSIADDVVNGAEAVVYTWGTWNAFVGLGGWRILEDQLDTEAWPTDRLTDRAREVVAYAGWMVARSTVEAFDWEGLD